MTLFCVCGSRGDIRFLWCVCVFLLFQKVKRYFWANINIEVFSCSATKYPLYLGYDGNGSTLGSMLMMLAGMFVAICSVR